MCIFLLMMHGKKGFTSLCEKLWVGGHEKQSGLSFKQHVATVSQSSKLFISFEFLIKFF